MTTVPFRIRLLWWLFRSPFTEFLREEAMRAHDGRFDNEKVPK